jgi:hypothetical protein
VKKDLYSVGSIGKVYLEMTFEETEGVITTNNNKTVK